MDDKIKFSHASARRLFFGDSCWDVFYYRGDRPRTDFMKVLRVEAFSKKEAFPRARTELRSGLFGDYSFEISKIS